MHHSISKFFSFRTNIPFFANYLLAFIWFISLILTLILIIKEQKLLTSINTQTSSNKSLENEIALLISRLKHEDYSSTYYSIYSDNNNNNPSQKIELTNSNVLDLIFYPYHSDIIETLYELELIRQWLGKASLHLVYKSSISGDSAKTFHKIVYNKSKFLFLIKTKDGARFGGYTSQSFDGQKMLEFDLEIEKKDSDMFLFSLNHYSKYDIVNKDKALFCDDSIIFGICQNQDLFIDDGFTKKESVSMFPKCFKGNNFALTLGSRTFVIEELEVFQVHFDEYK